MSMYPERVLIIIIDKAVYNKNMKNKNTNLFLTFFIKLISYIKTDIKYTTFSQPATPFRDSFGRSMQSYLFLTEIFPYFKALLRNNSHTI